MSSAEASLVRDGPLPGNAWAREILETYGPRQRELSLGSARSSSSSRTSRPWLRLHTFTASSSESLRLSGLRWCGRSYELPMLERLIEGLGSGSREYELPTPARTNYGSDAGGAGPGPARPSLEQMASRDFWPTPDKPLGGRGLKTSELRGRTYYSPNGVKKQMGLEAAVKLWLTPRATDGNHGGRVTPRKGREGGNLTEAISANLWPTPRANERMQHNSQDSGEALSRAVHSWPTPTPRDYKDTGDSIAAGTVPVNRLLGRAIGPSKTNGSLDPEFVEYLMAWPIGSSALVRSETGRYRLWLRQHSGFWSGD